MEELYSIWRLSFTLAVAASCWLVIQVSGSPSNWSSWSLVASIYPDPDLWPGPVNTAATTIISTFLP